MAMVSIKKDLFGKSDAIRNLCSKHAPRYSMVSSQVNEKAVGGSDVCHTCEAHVVAILDLEKERDALAAEMAQQKGWHANWLKVEPQYIARIDALEAANARLNRFADFLCRQNWTSRGRAIAEEAFDNAVSMDSATLETACGECGGSGLTMQPGMPDGEPEGKPCPKCKSKQFAPIGNGTICSNCTKTIGYHYQTAAGVLWCEVPKETSSVETKGE
jgi:hypothetical protein